MPKPMFSPEELAQLNVPIDSPPMSHAWLLQLRNKFAPTDPVQGMLSRKEHEAWAREFTQQNPVLAGAAIPWLTPGYAAYKSLFRPEGSTPPSLGQVGAGYKGLLQGYADLLKKNPQMEGILRESMQNPWGY